MTVTLIAHRAPREVRARDLMVAAGARMFELDVQLRDEQVVVSHYLPIRLPGPMAGVALQRDNWRVRRGPGRDPLLSDVLAGLPPTVDVLLDPKHHPLMSAQDLQAALLRVVARVHRPERFAVSTSGPALLAGYRDGGLRTWRSIGDAASLRRIIDGGPIPEEGVSVRHSLLHAETVRQLHAITGIIVAWTVNGVRRAVDLVDLGVDAITTDSTRVLSTLNDRNGASA